MRSPKATVNLQFIVDELNAGFSAIKRDATRDGTQPISREVLDALGKLEVFCAVALRVLRTTNPSKVRAAVRDEEIKHWIEKGESRGR